MKAKQQRQKQLISYKTKAALLAGALALSLLAGCGANESEAVVTEDDLTPASAAQDALQQEAGSGKTYRYFWAVEDPQRGEEWARSRIEERDRERVERPENSDEETQALFARLHQQTIDLWLEDLAKQQQLPAPAVSPQEAANLAGRMLEQVYGLDLSAEELMLWLTEIGFDPQTEEPQYMVWKVTDLREERFLCEINAETAAYEYLSYEKSWDTELAEAEQTPRAGCCHTLNESDSSLVWEPDSPEFAPLTRQMMDEISTALSGSLLVDGAQVTSVELLPLDPIVGEGEPTVTDLHFIAHCDNGQDYHLWGGRLKFYPEYDCGGYPLRGYIFGPVKD